MPWTRRLILALLIPLTAVLLASCASAPVDHSWGGSNPVAPSFEKEGKASYYGPGFAGKPTASGEKFDPKAMTAAHKNLPFGTKLRVSHATNGKSVVVRVNDRFPGGKGRVIDLSEGAFEKLAPKAAGVIDVRLEQVP